MTKNDIEQLVVNLLREVSMGRLDQEIVMDQPIGKQELGLDSLGLVEFVAALEKMSSVEIPDSIWKIGGRLTPSDFVNLIIELHSLPAGYKESIHVGSSPQLAASASDIKNISAASRQQGILVDSRWVPGRIKRRIIGSIYATNEYVILRHDLDHIPNYGALSKTQLQFREILKADRASFESFWAPHARSKMLKNFDQRLDGEFICLGAWRDMELVGIDYLASVSHTDPDTGLKVKTLPGSCFAFELFEKYPDKAIGSMLLGYSLSETKRRGFKRQVTFVNERNVRMLIATIQLFGYKEIGRIRSRRLFRNVDSEFIIEDQLQHGGTIVI